MIGYKETVVNPKDFSLLIALAAITCAIAIGACGSSSKPIAEAGVSAPGIRYADCMRAHGVPSFPDPSGAGVQLSGSGINTQSPAFRSAQSTCQKLLPGGIGGPVGVSAMRIEQGVKLAACMRAHGLRSFPDPTTTPPSPSAPPPSDGVILGGPDGVFSLSASMVQSPAFKHAGATCGFRFPASGHAFKMPVAAPTG